MGFYHLNAVSLIFLGMVYSIATVLFWLLWTKGLGWRFRGGVVWTGITVILVTPWIEELWVAYRFGQLCDQAGRFVYKKVSVSGFYDNTTHWWRQLADSGYQFVESRDSLYQTLWRAERENGEIRHFRIDQPTARYHYDQPESNLAVSHKIFKHSEEVRDTQSGEILGKTVAFGRTSPWFFVALDDPGMTCPQLNATSGLLLYQLVLVSEYERTIK